MKQVCGAMGVRTDVSSSGLTPEEHDIVFNGPTVKKHILYKPKEGDDSAELSFTYFNAVYMVENALVKARNEKGLKRMIRFLREGPCAGCGGTRLSVAVRAPHVRGLNLAEAGAMTLDAMVDWVHGVPESLPADMRSTVANICESFLDVARRLLDLGFGYLALDRAGAALSTGEHQRMQLAWAVHNRTTDVLYVLDEPSIGLRPSNMDGLPGVVRDLAADGNSVVVMNHDTRVFKAYDHLTEMGPVAGAGGGRVITQGTVGEVAANPSSHIAPFLSGKVSTRIHERMAGSRVFDLNHICMTASQLHTVKPLDVNILCGRLMAMTGVPGSGKTTMVLESLIPTLKVRAAGERLPEHVLELKAEGINRVNLVDATPVGTNVRSAVATYVDIHDELRRALARCETAKTDDWKTSDFSYNIDQLRCPTCDDTGSISLGVQFLLDATIEYPDCGGSRYAPKADTIRRAVKGEPRPSLGLPQLMTISMDQALAVTSDLRKVHARLTVLHDLGLGYLALGKPTPAFSGSETQWLRLASGMDKVQSDTVFVFDKPAIGLHPLDVHVLLDVFDQLVSSGVAIMVIEHDLDMIANAGWIIDMSPSGGESDGHIVATGTPEQIAANPNSITRRYLCWLVWRSCAFA